MIARKIQKVAGVLLMAAALLTGTQTTGFAAEKTEPAEFIIDDGTGSKETSSPQSVNTSIDDEAPASTSPKFDSIAYFLQTEEDIQYYAHLDLTSAQDHLICVILEARNQIIHRYSWVADGREGYVYDARGNLVEQIPHFSDLFPPDWEEPVYPKESLQVDLSYYGK